MSVPSRFRAGLCFPDEKPAFGAHPIPNHLLTPNVAAWMCNEGGGLKLFDCINGIHGTFGTGATEPNWIAKGLEFDDGDHVDCGDDSKIINHFEGTVVSKFFLYSMDTNHTVMAYGGGNTTYPGSITFLNVREYESNFYLAAVSQREGISGWDQIRGNTIISTGILYSAAMTSNGSEWKFYLDGKKETLSVEAGVNKGDWFGDINSAEPDHVSIGNVFYDGAWGSETMDGIIFFVYVYDYELQPSEILKLHEDPYCWLASPVEDIHFSLPSAPWFPGEKPAYDVQPISNHPLAPNIAAWLFNEDGGLEVFDLSGKRNVGTIADATRVPEGILFSEGDKKINLDTINTGTTFSIVSSIRNLTESPYVYRVIIDKWESGQAFALHGTKMCLYYGGSSHDADTSLLLGNRNQCAVSVDNGAGQFYLDGKPDGNCSEVTSLALSVIGNNTYTTTHLGGILGYLFIYDFPLTQAQMAQLYADPYCWIAQPMERTSIHYYSLPTEMDGGYWAPDYWLAGYWYNYWLKYAEEWIECVCSDILGKTDSQGASLISGLNISDILGGIDSSGSSLTMNLSALDIVALADTPNTLLEILNTCLDVMGESDTSNIQITFANTVLDMFSKSDSGAAQVTLTTTSQDILAGIESVNANLEAIGNALDVLAAIDSNLLNVIFTSGVLDIAGVTDSGATAITFNLSASDITKLPEEVESIIGEIILTCLDNMAQSDSNSAQITYGTIVIDINKHTDSGAAEVTLTITAEDILAETDSINGNLEIIQNALDVLSTVDSNLLNVTFAASASDIAKAVESGATVITFNLISSDTMKISDADQSGITFSISALDTLKHTDSDASFLTFISTCLDTLKNEDVSQSVCTFLLNSSAILKQSDAASFIEAIVLSCTDWLKDSDTANSLLTLIAQGSDIFKAQDTSMSYVTMELSLSDIQKAHDTSSITRTIIAGCLDSLKGMDSTTAQSIFTRSSSDFLSALDDPRGYLSFERSASEYLKVTDASQLIAELTLQCSDILKNSEYDHVRILFSTSSLDIVGATDTNKIQAILGLSAEDKIKGIDNIKTSLSFIVNALDNTSLSDLSHLILQGKVQKVFTAQGKTLLSTAQGKTLMFIAEDKTLIFIAK